jgi:hypothetical protein
VDRRSENPVQENSPLRTKGGNETESMTTVVRSFGNGRQVFYTVPPFVDHLTNDALPPLLDRLSSNKRE